MKTMIRVAALAFALGAISLSAHSATWHFIRAGNDETIYYFDQDTVEKAPGSVTLWLKLVQSRKADTDGSWATAARWKINCSKRTIQTLSMSTYDATGKFIRSFNNPTTEKLITPDTTGESVQRIACQSDFPRNKSEKDYFKIDDNDVFAATRRLVEWADSRKDSAPQ